MNGPGGAEAITPANRELHKGPRACPFCQSRHLVNQEAQGEAGWYRVECLFCHGSGPKALTQHDAWRAWDGDLLRASKDFGTPQSLVGG